MVANSHGTDDNKSSFEGEQILIIVYPNPTSDNFSMEINPKMEIANAVIQVYSTMGKEIIRKAINPDRTSPITIEDQPGGIYLLRVLTAVVYKQ